MNFLGFRDAVIADMKAEIVDNYKSTPPATGRPFRDVFPAPRRIDEDWLQHVVATVPSIHVCFIGSTRSIDRNHMGQFTGPWALVAHVVAKASGLLKPEASLLDKLNTLADWIEGRNFGYAGAGPAIVTDVENLWDIEVDKEGYALGSIIWQQEVRIGPNRLLEAENARPLLDQDGVPFAMPDFSPPPAALIIDPPADPFDQVAWPPLPD